MAKNSDQSLICRCESYVKALFFVIVPQMLGVWIVNEWLNCYTGQELQLVELGPGRGTLADDMLRVTFTFIS